ncbi:MAG: hypothetical protein ACI9R3_001569 [Verrucomicrobiales bacterium]|jgi:hypothetical protein
MYRLFEPGVKASYPTELCARVVPEFHFSKYIGNGSAYRPRSIACECAVQNCHLCFRS